MNSFQDTDDISKYKYIKSKTIKQEINRFESVHPCIYEIYDLLDQISELKVSSQIREFVHCIEDSFINSQEWTLTHGIHEIRLGILGATCSGKSSLIHRYLTGTYIQNEYDEGGRFKKEVVLDGDESYLMLIRDDGAEPPDYQFSNWVDGVIFVFSLEKEESLSVLYKLHEQLFKLRNNGVGGELPCILVGTQDYISESNPRVIDDSRARKLAADLKMSAYYETCATYGLNVEKVFQEGAISLDQVRIRRLQREIGMKIQPKPINNFGTSVFLNHHNQHPNSTKPLVNSAMNTISKFKPSNQVNVVNKVANNQQLFYNSACAVACPPVPPTRDSSQSLIQNQHFGTIKAPQKNSVKSKQLSTNSSPVPPIPALPNNNSNNIGQNQFGSINSSSHANDTLALNNIKLSDPSLSSAAFHQHSSSSSPSTTQQFNRSSTTSVSLREKAAGQVSANTSQDIDVDEKSHNCATGTPNQVRKVRRRSTLFKTEKKTSTNGIGVGRAIPIKQGLLYKRRGDKTLAKERTKKYVTLTSDARLTYHPNLNDYMEDVHGKEIDLSRVTIKIPGIVYRHGAGGIPTMGAGVKMSALKMSRNRSSDPTGNSRGFRDLAKKQRRKAQPNDSDSFEFQIVSLDGKQWSFESVLEEERDEWVMLIEQAILECLKNMDIRRSPLPNNSVPGNDNHGSKLDLNESTGDRDQAGKNLSPTGESTSDLVSDAESRKKMIQEISLVSGNDFCADCGQTKPEWASLNLGELVCIECSGVHRKLGTHISRVRSLQLDQWAQEWQAVMKAIGNTVANTVWEAAVNVSPRNLKKPESNSNAKEKEEWIRSKYERREFLPPLPCPGWPIQQQLIDAISRRDIRQVILCLAIASEGEVNASYSRTDPRSPIHIAAAIGDIVCLQLIIWYKGQVDLKDTNGRNAYFYAKMYGQDNAAEFLIKNGCSRQQIPATVSGPPPPFSSNFCQTPGGMGHNMSYISNTMGMSSAATTGPVTNRSINDSGFISNTISKKNLFSSSPKQPASAQNTTNSR